jgi:peptide/nickel transport system substrate-binding protein
MPARLAATGPFKQINEYVGSGSMRFVRNEWVPRAKTVFEKVATYVPRQERPSWLAGGKQIAVNRIEFVTIAEAGTGAAALQNGEVDWWELALPDIVPALRKNRNVTGEIAGQLGTVGTLFFNHLHPPFNDVRARWALLMALHGLKPGSLHDRLRRQRPADVEADARQLHPWSAAIYREWRRNPQRQTRPRRRQAAAY